jgi:hypothetical protein
MISTLRSFLVAFLCAATIACGDTIVNVPTTPTPTVTTPPVVKNTVQFRVLGNATSARIRYAAPLDGLAQVVTSLPYSNSFTTSSDTMFLSLEATPISYGGAVFYPFLSVQIVVNNQVFREASTQDFLLLPLAVSGQWRQ